MVIVEKRKKFTLNTVPASTRLFLHPAIMLSDRGGYARNCSQKGCQNGSIEEIYVCGPLFFW